MPSYLRFDRWQNTAGTQFSNIIQTQFVSWTNVTTNATEKTYVPLTGGTITITSTLANTKFLLMAHVNGYRGTSGGGTNIGFSRVLSGVTTRLLGVDGGNGESWMGEGNAGTSNSWNIPRNWMDSPGVPAGTAITYNVLGGNWTSAGTSFFNYSGYTLTSMLTVIEIQP